jgi:zinc transporter 1/2/3
MVFQAITLKTLSIIVIFGLTIISGIYPFLKRIKSAHKFDFPLGQALAAGIFLGAGLLHMLGDATAGFIALGYHFPLSFLLAGTTFLFLLLLEHLGREIYEHEGSHSNHFAILAVVMLALHSLFEGTALGLSESTALTAVILLAILAHKWAASFALAVQINQSHLSVSWGIILFLIFAIMTPLGILFGSMVTSQLNHSQLLSPIMNALAAGTFLYLGTLHGLTSSVLVKQCCNLANFMMVLVGFAIMAVVAIWI